MNSSTNCLGGVEWQDLNFLFIDLPPGTGNESVTTIDLLGNVSGAVIITTPQEVALLDSRKSVTFCKDSEVPIIGIVENMSGLECPHCHNHIEVFRKGGGEASAIDMGVPFLGRIPLDPDVVIAVRCRRAVCDVQFRYADGRVLSRDCEQGRSVLQEERVAGERRVHGRHT